MDYYEKCCQYQNIDLQIFDCIYTYDFNTSSFEINSVFLVGAKIIPPYKTLGWGARFPLLPTPPAVTNLFTRAFQQLKSIGSGKCNPLENV